MMQQKTVWIWILILSLGGGSSSAQEVAGPLRWNPALSLKAPLQITSVQKTTALALPFFEDFLGSNLYPDAAKWIENRQVYTNNTMAFNPPAQGVATFDALGANGRPYDTVTAAGLNYADSLTTQPFDLTSYTPADSLYLSFFYQPQGVGFSPEKQDSFMLFIRDKNGLWIKQWADTGSTLKPFRQVMIPVRDTDYFYDKFQFRFVNKASINLNDDVWNLDYIRFAAGRTANDTLVNDLALSAVPSFYLSDYTSMPYAQYGAAGGSLRAQNLILQLRNNTPNTATVGTGYTAFDTRSNAAIGSAAGTLSLPAKTTSSANLANYTAMPAAGLRERVVFRNRFYLQTALPQFSTANDTLEKDFVFDNYLAYDDGTAEKSYFLNLQSSLPGKIALEYRTYVADTLRGAAILFGQQVPTSAGKFFTINIYRHIAGIDNQPADEILYTQEFYQPLFIDSTNRFWNYTFDNPVALPAGTFYLGLMQPALSGSDSLYYALDANRIGGNHLYFNVTGTWQSSTISGAVMARPLLGAPVRSSAVETVVASNANWSVYPNPGSGYFSLTGVPVGATVRVFNLAGRTAWSGPLPAGGQVELPQNAGGLYLVQWQDKTGIWSAPKKWTSIL